MAQTSLVSLSPRIADLCTHNKNFAVSAETRSNGLRIRDLSVAVTATLLHAFADYDTPSPDTVPHSISGARVFVRTTGRTRGTLTAAAIALPSREKSGSKPHRVGPLAVGEEMMAVR